MSSEIDELKTEVAALKKLLADELGLVVDPRHEAVKWMSDLGYESKHVELACGLSANIGNSSIADIVEGARIILFGFDVHPYKNVVDVVVEKTINTTIEAAKKVAPIVRKTIGRIRRIPNTNGRNMARETQIGLARKHLNDHGIPSDTVDVESHMDSSLSFAENWKNMTRFVGISSNEHRRMEMERFNDQARAAAMAEG